MDIYVCAQPDMPRTTCLGVVTALLGATAAAGRAALLAALLTAALGRTALLAYTDTGTLQLHHGRLNNAYTSRFLYAKRNTNTNFITLSSYKSIISFHHQTS